MLKLTQKPLLLLFLLTGFSAFAQSAGARYAIIPENPRPGEPVTVAAALDVSIKRATLVSAGKILAKAAFFSVSADDGGQLFLAAVLTVPSTAAPGKALIRLEGDAIILGGVPLEIAPRQFVSEEIALNETLTALRTAPDPQKTAEANRLTAILGRSGGVIYCMENFQPPVAATRRTSFFGDRRVFRYSSGKSDTSIHAGVDFGIPTGTAVTACASGKVALACPRIVTGNSVIIEHLPGVYSLYYHLDSISVTDGVTIQLSLILLKRAFLSRS
jgi:murein DD-endopeptidase MepM/ murein hydrolase activator NlpD